MTVKPPQWYYTMLRSLTVSGRRHNRRLAGDRELWRVYLDSSSDPKRSLLNPSRSTTTVGTAVARNRLLLGARHTTPDGVTVVVVGGKVEFLDDAEALYDKMVYDDDGYDDVGYNRDGFDDYGRHRNGTPFGDDGYDSRGYDEGFDRDGLNREMRGEPRPPVGLTPAEHRRRPAVLNETEEVLAQLFPTAPRWRIPKRRVATKDTS